MALTISRLGFAVAVAFVLPGRQDEMWATWACLIMLLLIEATDALDGYCARRFNVVSELGKMLDPYADSISRIIVFWTMARSGRCWEILPLCMAVRDITCAYARIALSMSGKSVAARWTGKVKAVVQGIAGGFLVGGPIWWGSGTQIKAVAIHVFSAAVVLILVISMFDYVAAAAKAWGPGEAEEEADAGDAPSEE